MAPLSLGALQADIFEAEHSGSNGASVANPLAPAMADASFEVEDGGDKPPRERSKEQRKREKCEAKARKKRRKAGLPPAELAVAEGPPASKGADFDGDET
jgi:hypothetical protein